MTQILIVDNDPIAIASLVDALKKYGEIRISSSGEEALELLSQRPTDLVLIDATLPGMDGYESCLALKHAYPDTLVIFITADRTHSSEVRALESGAVDFIAKPFNRPVIQARVNTQLKLKQHTDMLRTLIFSDPVTKIANRRHLDEQAEIEWRRSLRIVTPITILMIDLDNFKAFNDRYGHIAGDECLHDVAQAIQGSVNRAGELVARFGGEEFTVLLPNSTPAVGIKLAELICETVRKLAIPHSVSSVSSVVTLSIGVASRIPKQMHQKIEIDSGQLTFGEPTSVRELFTRADAALYLAKQNGRNRVVLHPANGEYPEGIKIPEIFSC